MATENTKTFTDEEGKKYELHEIYHSGIGYVIKPVEDRTLKKNHVLLFREFASEHNDDLMNRHYNLTDPTAQALAEVIGVAVECVTSADDPFIDQYLLNRIQDARKLYQKEQDNE